MKPFKDRHAAVFKVYSQVKALEFTIDIKKYKYTEKAANDAKVDLSKKRTMAKKAFTNTTGKSYSTKRAAEYEYDKAHEDVITFHDQCLKYFNPHRLTTLPAIMFTDHDGVVDGIHEARKTWTGSK